MEVDGKYRRMVTSIYLIRHGQIDANVERRWFGSTDQELNSVGHQQAEKLADYLVANQLLFDHLYCSPLKRTRVTAEKIGDRLGMLPLEHHGLVEFGIGIFEATVYEDLVTEHKFFENIEEDLAYSPEGGESVLNVAQRMLSAIREVKDKHLGKNIGIVGHGAAFGIALSQLTKNEPYPFYEFHMDNTAITKLELFEDQVEISFFNRSDHLEN